MSLHDAHFAILEKKLKARRLHIVEQLGLGTFAIVYRVADRKGREYALKVLFPSPEELPLGPKARQRMEDEQFGAERDIHLLVSGHPNVLTCHDTFTAHNLHCLLLDIHSGGTLLEYASETPRFWRNDAEIKRVFTQLIDGVDHCHTFGISHRDLKPENILTDPLGDRYVVADFGLATTFEEDIVSNAGSDPYKSPESFPELLDDMYNTRSADLWALGIILINMICGFMPWRAALLTDSDYAQYSRDPLWLRTCLPLSTSAASLLARLLEPDPSKRLSLAELRREVQGIHRFLMNDAELRYAAPPARSKMAKHAKNIGVTFSLPPAARSSSETIYDDMSVVPPLTLSCTSAPSFVLDSPPSIPFNSAQPDDPAFAYDMQRKSSVLSRMFSKLRLRTTS